MTETDLAIGHVASPIGDIVLVASARGLTRAYFPGDADGLMPQQGSPAAAAHLEAAREALRRYFSGDRDAFQGLTLAAEGTEFQKDVWNALSAIPFGETRAYREIAETVGRPKAVRAVGLANGRNPIPIIVPCHRVIGADGSLTGFGGGLPLKEWLLAHEGVRAPVLL